MTSSHYFEGAIDDLLDGDEVDDLALEVGDQVAVTAAGLAPKETGAGAASIHAELNDDGDAEVGWDSAHDYMKFAEEGTVHEAPRPFLRPAGDSAHL